MISNEDASYTQRAIGVLEPEMSSEDFDTLLEAVSALFYKVDYDENDSTELRSILDAKIDEYELEVPPEPEPEEDPGPELDSWVI